MNNITKFLFSLFMGTTIAATPATNTTPEPAVVAVVEPSKVDVLVEAIISFEGNYEGSRGERNNNPGNLRYAGQAKAIGKDDDNFAIFATYQDGRDTLKELIVRAQNGSSTVYRPDMTLVQFFHVYAPAHDSNDPDFYAKTVASRLGVGLTTTLREL